MELQPISRKQLSRAHYLLMNDDKGKDKSMLIDIGTVDEVVISLKWLPNMGLHQVMNPIYLTPKNGECKAYCRTCKVVKDHIMNMEATKVKCLKCNTVTDIEI